MTVTIYSTPTCSFCKAAKAFLTQQKIEYKEVDVANDQDQANKMIELSGQMGVPVIVVEKDGQQKVIVGFQENELKSVLGI